MYMLWLHGLHEPWCPKKPVKTYSPPVPFLCQMNLLQEEVKSDRRSILEHHCQYCCTLDHRPVLAYCSWDHFVYAPSQWETLLQCDVVPHWLGTFTKWSLCSLIGSNLDGNFDQQSGANQWIVCNQPWSQHGKFRIILDCANKFSMSGVNKNTVQSSY